MTLRSLRTQKTLRRQMKPDDLRRQKDPAKPGACRTAHETGSATPASTASTYALFDRKAARRARTHKDVLIRDDIAYRIIRAIRAGRYPRVFIGQGGVRSLRGRSNAPSLRVNARLPLG